MAIMDNNHKKALADSKKLANEKKYWINKLGGELVMSGFLPDFKRIRLDEYRVEVLNYRLPNDIFQKLVLMSKNFDVALYMILLSDRKSTRLNSSH